MKILLAAPLVAAALATAAGTALAQAGPKEPKAAPPKAPPPPPAQAGPPPVAAVLFPCRTEGEVCYVGVVRAGKLVVLFTNDPKAEEITGRPLAMAAGQGSAPDLGANEGRLVMMTGRYAPADALTGAVVVDVAGPLTAFAIKAALGGGGEEAPPPPPSPPPGRKR